MADVQVKYTSDMQKLLRDQDRQLEKHEKTIKKLQETVRGAKKAGDSLQDAGKRGSASLGSRFGAEVSRTVESVATLSAAVRVVGDAMRFVKEETDGAMESFDRLSGTRTLLNQVAESSADRQRLATRAKQLAAAEGVDRRDIEAVLFQARSEKFEGATVDAIVRNARIVAPRSAAQVAGQFPGLFKGQIAPLESINTVLAAARASRAGFEEIASASPVAAQGAALAGASPAETLGILSVLAGKTSKPQESATLIRGLGTKLSLDANKDLGGKGILEGVRRLNAATEERRNKFLGESQELNVAFSLINENIAAIRQQEQLAQRAIETSETSQSVLNRQRRFAFDPNTDIGRTNLAARQRDIERARREILLEESLSQGGFGAQAALDREQSRLLRQRRSGLSRFGAATAGQAAQLFTQNEQAVTFASRVGAESIANPMGIVTMFREAVRSFEIAAKQLNRSQRPNNKSAARQVPSLATE